MSDIEEDNEHFCFYGEPLDPYDEDCVPRKKPVSVEEQIATDAQGRRRFHGAFTGGFSAGFFNTVGSLEGWRPSEFKSSRSEKSKGVSQKPEDFMDDEDLGDDGFAPQAVRATKEYNTSRKRKKQVFSEGPIPGEPVLHNILSNDNETIGYMLMKNLRIKERKKNYQDKTYGCQMPKFVDDEDQFKDLCEIPEIYKEFLNKPKNDTFGLGYHGLDDRISAALPIQQNVKTALKITDKNNKKLSISGQAFGVGAFEEEDTDIYIKDDMTKYDFELVSEKEAARNNVKKNENKLVLDMFNRSKHTPVLKTEIKYPLATIPQSFTGKYKIRKSRFEPKLEEEEKAPSSSRINPTIRAKYLGEDTVEEYTASKSVPTQQEVLKKTPKSAKIEAKITQNDIDSYLNDRFVSASTKEDVNNILEEIEKTETLHGTPQMRDAVRMKMFGPLTRITSDFIPCSLLCKRFNVPEPFADKPSEKKRTKTKNIIFEYQKHLEEKVPLEPGLTNNFNRAADEEVIIKNDKSDSTSVSGMEIVENNDATEEKKEKEIAPSTLTSVIDITERLNLENNQDLFKAIFCSSDEEEEEKEEDDDQNKSDQKEEINNKDNADEENEAALKKKEEMKSLVLSDQLIPKIRPLKQGLLSGIEFKKREIPPAKLEETVIIVDDDSYGPKIPEIKSASNNTAANNHHQIENEEDDEWVEKSGVADDDHHQKKSKKHHKHKKHHHHHHQKHKKSKK